MPDIDSFKEKLLSLISKFEKDKTHYLSKGYHEAQVRSVRKYLLDTNIISYYLKGIENLKEKITSNWKSGLQSSLSRH